MDENNDEKFDHIFFSDIDHNISVSNTNEDEFNKKFSLSNNMFFLFISTYVAFLRIKKIYICI